ncbi:hypothetical protein [Polycladospora coralii]|nr:hypothetical protein [Polycladospora coralii]
MFVLPVDAEINLQLVALKDREVDRDRSYLREWLQWVDRTLSLSFRYG